MNGHYEWDGQFVFNCPGYGKAYFGPNIGLLYDTKTNTLLCHGKSEQVHANFLALCSTVANFNDDDMDHTFSHLKYAMFYGSAEMVGRLNMIIEHVLSHSGSNIEELFDRYILQPDERKTGIDVAAQIVRSETVFPFQ